jgi:hypothetical protein
MKGDCSNKIALSAGLSGQAPLLSRTILRDTPEATNPVVILRIPLSYSSLLMERKSVQAIVQTEETFDHPNLSQYGISDATENLLQPEL